MINLIAPINNLGYGVAGYNIFKSLYGLDPTSALYPISRPEFVDAAIQSGLDNRSRDNSSNDCVKIWHQNDLYEFVGKGRHIGFPIFELTEFNDEEKTSLNHCDKIFVCSKWAKQIILDQMSHKFSDQDVHVVPLGVDVELFAPVKSGRTPTIFLNCGKWEKRKGHDVLLECFNSAFTQADDVELWMMCDNPFIGKSNQDWQDLYKSSPLGDKIRIIPRQKTHQDVYNIMKQADCGIFPSRAEGWNLELLEMMTCGKQVIATNYSAHTEFCDNKNALLVDIENLETAHDGVFFDGSRGLWANIGESEKEQTVCHMRAVHGDKKQNNLELNEAGTNTGTRFSWDNSAKELVNGL
jgi:glycosyltransferase involved in cell wall biosynthesis